MMPNKFTNLNAFYVMNSRHRYSCEMVIYRELVDDLIKYVDHICPATELQQKWVKQISEDKHLNINQDDLKSYSYCHTFLNNHFAKRGLDEMSFKDEQLSLEKKMVMRDFKEVIETWKIAQRNLTTFDYKELDQALDKKLRAFEKERAQAIINKHIAVKEDVLANVIKEYNEDKQLTLDTIEKAPNIKPKETLTPKPIKVKKDTKAKVKEDKPKEAIVDPRQMQFNFDSMENKLTITPQNEDLYKAYGGLDNTQKQQLELDLRLAEELKKEDDSQKLKNVILKDKAKMSKNQNTENTVNQAKNKIAKKTKKVNDENTLKEERIKKQKEKNKAHFEQFNLNIDVNKEEIKKKIKK